MGSRENEYDWSVEKNNTIYILSDLELSNRKKNQKITV